MIKQETSAGDKLVLEVEFTGRYEIEVLKDWYLANPLVAKGYAESKCEFAYGDMPGFRIQNTDVK